MPTPKEIERTAAFCAWLTHVGGVGVAHHATGISRQTIMRMRAGKQPPPARLLDELAIGAADAGATDLGRLLTDAAQPGDR